MALRKGAGCQPMMYSTPYCVGTFMHATPISQVHVLGGIDAVLPEVAPQRAGGSDMATTDYTSQKNSAVY